MKKPVTLAVACSFVFTLIVNDAVAQRSLSPQARERVEKAQADRFIKDYGKSAMVHSLRTIKKETSDDLIIKYAEYFLSKGSDVDAKDTLTRDAHGFFVGGSTALHWMVRYDRIAVVKFLVAQKASMTERDEYGMEPIHTAAGTNKVEILKFLIAQGADVNAKDLAGNTPLYHAIMNKNSVAVKFLIDAGADENAKNNKGQTPQIAAMVAAQEHQAEMQRIAREGAEAAKCILCDGKGYHNELCSFCNGTMSLNNRLCSKRLFGD